MSIWRSALRILYMSQVVGKVWFFSWCKIFFLSFFIFEDPTSMLGRTLGLFDATKDPWALRFLVVREIDCGDWLARGYMEGSEADQLLAHFGTNI